MFSVTMLKLNKAIPYKFSNTGLIDGVVCRTNLANGVKHYYTSAYDKCSNYSMAVALQRRLNSKK